MSMFDFELFTPLYILSFSLVLFVVYCLLQSSSRRPDTLPPGPKPWPIIGNILDMPRKDESATFSQWGRLYGTLLSFRSNHNETSEEY